MNNLVIVESPAKASTIEKILGKDFKVVSSYGHVRDLAKKNMGIDIENAFSPQYEVSIDKKKVISVLNKESKKSDIIWLATDEDREGEAIAWHLYEVLGLKNKNVNRIVFNEITQSAIKNAILSPRSIDYNLVNAQQARRVLDRIVGFKLSPILWKKVRAGLSAGRVQSVAVRLIVEKEKNINQFESSSFYQVSAEFLSTNNDLLQAELVQSVNLKSKAEALLDSFINAHFKIQSMDTKPSKSSPPSPFTTSSLQQSASSRLGFSVSRTMNIAQKLYESGHITYMRTDSTNLSNDARANIKKYIIEKYGENYFQKRQYLTKNRTAQEAHEAIRPTEVFNLNCGLDEAQKKLYYLIWERTLCSQMSDAIIDKTTINIDVDNSQKSVFQSKGQVIRFDGYLRIQKEFSNITKKDKLLPILNIGEELITQVIVAKQKYNKPPSRYTEASLVKKLEELGIGRPSTYAPTISTIQKREYVVRGDVEGYEKAHNRLVVKNKQIFEDEVMELVCAEKKKLIPTEMGKLTNDFLVNSFEDILEYNFTAKIESQFDDVASGKKEWTQIIKSFYQKFEPNVMRVDKHGSKVTGLRRLGVDPGTQKIVYVRLGKYGPMVQLGELEEGKEKPRYASLKKGQTMENIDLESALQLLSLPRLVGQFEEQDVFVSEGRYGPYIKHKNEYISLGDLSPFTIRLSECIDLINSKREYEKQKIINTFQTEQGVALDVCNGKYGPYLRSGKRNYKIPKELDPKKITQKDCLEIIKKSPKK